jgi:hypothetical protein
VATEITPGVTLDTRWPDDESIEDPDTSETYPGESEEPATDPWETDVEEELRKNGFSIKRLRQAWGEGQRLL